MQWTAVVFCMWILDLHEDLLNLAPVAKQMLNIAANVSCRSLCLCCLTHKWHIARAVNLWEKSCVHRWQSAILCRFYTRGGGTKVCEKRICTAYQTCNHTTPYSSGSFNAGKSLILHSQGGLSWCPPPKHSCVLKGVLYHFGTGIFCRKTSLASFNF